MSRTCESFDSSVIVATSPWDVSSSRVAMRSSLEDSTACRRGTVDDPGTTRAGTAAGPRAQPSDAAGLLDLDARAGLLELALELVGLVAVDALLDGLRGLVDERLGLLEAETGCGADDLDHLDLLVAGAREDDVERRLLLGGRAVAVGGTAARRGGGGGDGCRRDAELLLERLDALGQLEDRDLLELVDPLLGAGGHGSSWFLGLVFGGRDIPRLAFGLVGLRGLVALRRLLVGVRGGLLLGRLLRVLLGVERGRLLRRGVGRRLGGGLLGGHPPGRGRPLRGGPPAAPAPRPHPLGRDSRAPPEPVQPPPD